MCKVIVVAIDDEPLLTSFGSFLESRDCRATLLNDLTAVKPVTAMLKPDLIIIDLLFDDEVKSLEVVKELLEKSSPVANIPIILSSTTKKISAEEEKCLKKEKVRVVPKPFDTKNLVTEMKAALGWDRIN